MTSFLAAPAKRARSVQYLSIARALGIADTGAGNARPPRVLRTRRVPAAWGSRVVSTAIAKGHTFTITVNRGYDSGGSSELIWNAAHQSGKLTG